MRHVQRITETAGSGLEYLQRCLMHSINIKVSFRFLTKISLIIEIQQSNYYLSRLIYSYILNCKKVWLNLAIARRVKRKT